jgi:Tol biopolymer transport system component
MLHTNYARLLSFAALCALVAACGDDTTPPVDNTCEPGEVCTCDSNDDCPTGQSCLVAQGVCIPEAGDTGNGDASDVESPDAGSDADTSTDAGPDGGGEDAQEDADTSTPDVDDVTETDADVTPDGETDTDRPDTTDPDTSTDIGPVLPADDYNPWIVFVTEVPSVGPRIDIATADGSQLRRLNFNTDTIIESPVWSPDGTQLAWAGASEPADTSVSVRVLDITTGDVETYNGVSGTPSIALIDGVTWSPDGTRIAVTGRGLSSRTSTLWVLNLADRTFDQIVADGRANFPVWSPDGDVIFYSGTEDLTSTDFEIWSVNPNGTNAAEVTSGSDIIGSFDVAWDGNLFAFPRTSGEETIYLWDRELDEYTAIGQSQDGDPDFFGHGNALAIGRIAGSGSPDIFTIDTDGDLIETITADDPASAQPNVSPIDASEIDVTGISSSVIP